MPSDRPCTGPDVAVGSIDPPGAVRVEILVANHVRRYVAGGDRGVVAAIARARPAIEVVGLRDGSVLVLAHSGSHEAIGLPRVDHERCVFAVDLALAPAHDDGGRIAFGIHFDPVLARLPQREGDVRRVDLEHLVAFEPEHAHVQCALRQLQLGDLIVEVDDRDARARVHADHGAADLDFGPSARIGPEAVAGRHRSVESCLHPVVLAGGREADRARHIAEARDARWRVRAGPAAGREHGDADHERERPVAEGILVHVISLRE
jgi:hypothetical protein